jgi:hypothetical protein
VTAKEWRNQRIYRLWRKGFSQKLLAEDFRISATRVRQICRQEERKQLERAEQDLDAAVLALMRRTRTDAFVCRRVRLTRV